MATVFAVGRARRHGGRAPGRAAGYHGYMTSNTDTVRAVFDAYRQQDRDTMDRLLADEFVFTSPQDDHIDKTAFFERCFPTADRMTSQEMIYVVPAAGDDVFAMYEYELTTGERHRNTELLTVRGGRVVETQVFFGGRVHS
jgi:ketosteroid isomerase-like protein